jgi:hypothetical protein
MGVMSVATLGTAFALNGKIATNAVAINFWRFLILFQPFRDGSFVAFMLCYNIAINEERGLCCER